MENGAGRICRFVTVVLTATWQRDTIVTKGNTG